MFSGCNLFVVYSRHFVSMVDKNFTILQYATFFDLYRNKCSFSLGLNEQNVNSLDNCHSLADAQRRIVQICASSQGLKCIVALSMSPILRSSALHILLNICLWKKNKFCFVGTLMSLIFNANFFLWSALFLSYLVQ